MKRIEEIFAVCDYSDLSLGSGLSGYTLLLLSCLNLLGEDFSNKYYEKIEELVKYTAKMISQSSSTLVKGGGLFNGPCGVALMLTVASRVLNTDYADVISQCLSMELDKYVETRSGGLQYDDGFRTLPYLMSGSGGLIIAAYFIGTNSMSDKINSSLLKIGTSISSISCLKGSLFEGAAGLILCKRYFEEFFSLDVTRYTEIPSLLSPHIFTAEYEGVPITASVGDGLRRLSLDYGTGISGIWSVFNSLENQNHDWFPIHKVTDLFEWKFKCGSVL